MLLLAGLTAADGAPPIYLKTNGMALFSMIIFFFAMIIYSANISKGGRLFAAIFLMPIMLFLFFIFTVPSRGYSIMLIPILGFLAVFFGAFQESEIKKITTRYSENQRHRMLFLTVLALLAIFSMMNMIGMDFPAHKSLYTANGWSRLTPQWSNTWYNARNQIFTASFTNKVGATIRIKEVYANETISNTTCTVAAPSKDITVNQGETLMLDAVCATANKRERDMFYMNIMIIYEDYKEGGYINTHTELGSMRGRVEA